MSYYSQRQRYTVSQRNRCGLLRQAPPIPVANPFLVGWVEIPRLKVVRLPRCTKYIQQRRTPQALLFSYCSLFSSWQHANFADHRRGPTIGDCPFFRLRAAPEGTSASAKPARQRFSVSPFGVTF